MAASRKKKAPARGTTAKHGQRPRYRLVEGEDGSLRAVRVRSAAQGARDQALADFLGVGPEISVSANMRGMESLLGEVLESLHLEEETMRPEILAALWKRAVGETLASYTELQSVSRHTARVWVGHPAVRFQLRQLKPKLLQVLNAELGEGCVKSISFVQ